MKNIFMACLCIFMMAVANGQQIKSPNGKILMQFSLQADGAPSYTLSYNNAIVIKPSLMGLELKDNKKSLLNKQI